MKEKGVSRAVSENQEKDKGNATKNPWTGKTVQ